MFFRAACLALIPLPALACDTQVCRVDPQTLDLARVITFDDMPSGWDPGHRIDEILPLDGASFAERFAGQRLDADGDFDTVSGPAFYPLTLLPGAEGQTFSVTQMLGTNILNGYGPGGFPRVDAQGEGAIAAMFDNDQSAMALQILGLENGSARIQFLARNGDVLHSEIVTSNETTVTLGFRQRDGLREIAGFVLTNTDPQGLAIDNLRFGPPPQLG